ncbi:MAG: OmpH family outer membrane protein [Sphingobacteriales bacterium]|nr:OmpH family outer membrane protein [Sphingobacteriales bacterium]
MKKLQVLIVAAVMLIAGNASAQTKIAFIRIDDIVGLMPELAPEKVNMDTVGAKFIRDSIMPGINYKQDQYNEKIKEFSDTTKKLSDQVKKIMLQEIQDLQNELSGVDQYLQQVAQNKQAEFLRPYYAKAKKAIEQVAKEKGYTHVMSSDVFLVAPEADDISLLVLTKLGIKLPNQNPPANKPATPGKTGGNN